MSAAAQTIGSPKKWAREYELIYVLRPNVEPAEAEKLSNRLSDVFTKMNAKLTKVDNWGKRKLAYPIRGHARGVFVYLRYVGFNDVVAEIERNLRISEPVMRFLHVRVRDEVNPAEVQVDPEEVKFTPIELTEDEPEPALEEVLGMTRGGGGHGGSDESREMRDRSMSNEEESDGGAAGEEDEG